VGSRLAQESEGCQQGKGHKWREVEATQRVATLETGGRTEGKDNDMGIRKSKSCSSTVSVVVLYLAYAVVVLSKTLMKYDALMMSRLRWSLVSTRRSPSGVIPDYRRDRYGRGKAAT